jgi:hypothetical protein
LLWRKGNGSGNARFCSLRKDALYWFDNPASATQGVRSDRAGGTREGQRKESTGAHKSEDWWVLRVSDAEEDDAAKCEKDLERPQAAGNYFPSAASDIADDTAFAVSTITALLLTGRFVALTIRHWAASTMYGQMAPKRSYRESLPVI